MYIFISLFGILTHDIQTYVGINNWVYHRSKSIFGEDADQFKPERWLAQDPNHLIQMHRNLISVSQSLPAVVPGHWSTNFHLSSLVLALGLVLGGTLLRCRSRSWYQSWSVTLTLSSAKKPRALIRSGRQRITSF